VNPLAAVAALTVAALAGVGVLGVLAARSTPDTRSAAVPAPGTDGNGRPAQAPAAQRPPATASALPAGTGTGRRVVYALGIRRVWVVRADDRVARTYVVPPGQPTLAPGAYEVYAKRSTKQASGSTRLRYVLLMEQGKGGESDLGFCSVPLTRSGKPAPPDSRAGGEAAATSCVQQKLGDARFLYRNAQVGTPVVVVP
jgi:hypothetical protein